MPQTIESTKQVVIMLHAAFPDLTDTVEISNGKVVERWANVDQMGMMMQLGLMPTPG